MQVYTIMELFLLLGNKYSKPKWFGDCKGLPHFLKEYMFIQDHRMDPIFGGIQGARLVLPSTMYLKGQS